MQKKMTKGEFNIYRFPFRGKSSGKGLFIFLLVFCFQSLTVAQTKAKKLLIKPLQDKVFIKEQGQFAKNARETKISFTEPILYGVENAEFNAYFTAHGIVFQFPERRNIEEKDRKKIDNEPEERTVETIWHTANMQWLNADPSVELIAEQKVSNYYNYSSFYGGFDDKTVYNFVPAYKRIKYTNLYPGVDAEFELPAEGGIKYRFIVKPDVVVPLISFQWDGLEKIITNEKGDLQLKSKFGPNSLNPEWQLLDHAPNAFTASSHVDIPVKFSVKDNKVEFKFSSENISSSEGIVIDPWITNTGYTSFNRAFDIQEDSLGNVFIQGNESNYHIEKYSPLGVLQWSYVTYSVFLGDIAVDNPGNTYIIGGYCSGKRQKLNPAGVQVWAQGGLCEEWRLAFNYSKTVLAICGSFYNPGGNNIAKLNLTTGGVSNQIAYNQETRSIATDCNGDMYSLHLPSGELRKTNADFTPGGVTASGLALIYAGTGYALNPGYSPSIYQGFNGTLIQGPYVYIYDGIMLRRFRKSTLTPMNSVTVPNGANYQCSGLSTDPCGNVYAGTTNGIVKFDSALVYMETIPTPGPVYDIIFASTGDLLACGQGFLGNFSINCATPPPLSVTVTSTNADCDGGTSSVLVSGGIAPYSYIWQPGGQTTDSIGNLAPGTYTYTVTDPFCRSYQDSLIITQIPPLIIDKGVIGVVSPGIISNESCPNTFNGSAIVTGSGGTPPYTYSWNTNPVQNTQTAIGLSEGIYLATIMDADSCTDTVSIVITRHPAPVAAFSSTKVCNGIATQFIDSATTPSGVISSRSWDFGDGSALDSTQNPSKTYANGGSYNATLIVSNNFGCADTITKPVEVYYNPITGFAYTDVCYRDSVFFSNSSSIDPAASIASYLWTFGDGSVSGSLQSPVHYYSNPGTFNIRLVNTSADGCADSLAAIVNVFDAPTSAFTFNAVCLYDSAHFINNSLNPSMGSMSSWSWNFGDGSPLNTTTWSSGHIYTTPGNYQVSLTTYSSNLGCPDTLQDTIIVSPAPIANFGLTDGCLNQAMIFNDSSTVTGGSITGRAWDFGDGSPMDTTASPSHAYTIHGNYTVTLLVTTDNGCTDSISKNIVIHPLPSVYFNALNTCDAKPVNFNNFSSIITTDTIQSYTWDFADGSPLSHSQSTTHLYATANSYAVKLVVLTNFGCSDSVTKTIIIQPNPVSNFYNTSVCHSNTTQFTDISTTSQGTITTWLWGFGDGSTSITAQNPAHLYTVAGNKTVTLIVSNSFGCKDTLTKLVQVYYNPIAGFNYSNICFGDTMNFTNTSSVHPSTSISTALWVFGDSSPTGNSQNISHYYSLPGTYTVTLVTTTADGCTDASIIPVKVFDAPNSIFTFSNTCLFDPAIFTNTSTSPTMGSTASWSWNFGDGSSLNTSVWSPDHQYPSPGNYEVTLITHSSNLACPDTLQDSITVYSLPIANFGFTDVCLNQTMSFNDLSTVSNGSITSRSWNFGDGTSPGGGPNPNHVYSNYGIFTVSLIVTTNNNCKDTITKTVVVHPLPDAQFSTVNVCDGSIVQFSDMSTIFTTDTIQSWVWSFGDGSPVYNNQNTSHLYATSGSYPVQLLTVSSFGCSDSISKISVVNPNPVVNFISNDTIGCEPLCINFQNSSTITPGANIAWSWSFGDSSSLNNLEDPVYCYSNDSVFAPNYFTVTLTVSSDSGCASSLSKNNYITVYPNPNAGFTVEPTATTIVNPVISITDLSAGANFWNWNYGDGSDTSSQSGSFPYTYADTGTYTIMLIASTQYNCVDTASQTIIIEPDYVFYIPNAFTPNDDGVNDTFSGKGVFIENYEMRIFDRWGNSIFFSDDINNPWDGKINHGSEIAPVDVYVYVVKIIGFNRSKHIYKGIVTLAR